MGPTVVWNQAVGHLAGFACDVVQILDCCCAIEAVDQLNSEIMAAAIETAGADIETSFTMALLKTLQSLQGKPTSLATVYSNIMRTRNKLKLQYIPIYVPKSGASVVLQPVGQAGVPPPITHPNLINTPKVLLSVDLDGNMTEQTVHELTEWLTSHIPSTVQRITVQLEGIFRANSSIILFTAPVEIWACLRQDDAYKFVSEVRSSNMLPRLELGGNLPV